jgi:hypothetical protein
MYLEMYDRVGGMEMSEVPRISVPMVSRNGKDGNMRERVNN